MRNGDMVGLAAAPSATMGKVGGSLTFDWVMVALSTWLVGGAFLDGWAHNHHKVDASFFTPWHAVLYTGFLALACWTVGALVNNRARGLRWQYALPPGYELALRGILVFAAGAIGDLIWHQVFGVEQSIEALYSPTHLTLAVGSALIVSGPFRAAWRRVDGASPPGWQQLSPMLLSLTLMLASFSFSAQVIHPLVPLRRAMLVPSTDALLFYLQILTIASVLVQVLLRMGLILLALRRWRLPPGSLTLVFTLNGLAMCTLDPRDEYGLLVPVILAGAVADGWLCLLQPTPERPWRFRLFAFTVPVVFYLFYFSALWLTHGYWWSVHLWTGTIVLGGLAGWLLSYLIVLPREGRSTHLE